MSASFLEIERELYGYPILAQIAWLDAGMHILLTGGQRGHVGAVSLARKGQLLSTLTFPGHREAVITEQWAVELSKRTDDDVTVACGIHYDHATQAEIDAVLKVAKEIFSQIAALHEKDSSQQNAK